MYVDVQNDNI